MLKEFSTLKFREVAANTLCIEPDRKETSVALEDQALCVFTDFRVTRARTITPEVDIDAGLQMMVSQNTRLLLVASEENKLLGLVTSIDISGEKPFTVMHQDGKKRKDVHILDIMTPIQALRSLDMRDVLEARVGDVLSTLRDTGSEYVLVTTEDQGHPIIRGLFSATEIARRLGIYFDPNPGARTFAEFAKALH